MLLRALVRGTDFRRFLDFLSPTFFDVMPARALARQATALAGSARAGAAHRAAVEARRVWLDGTGWPVRLEPDGPPGAPLDEVDDADAEALGELVLRLYFGQLFAGGTALLDLRRRAFSVGDDGRLVWRPRALSVDWAADFRAPMVQVYRGFYEDDEAMFCAGLDRLDLGPAADVLRRHFGEGDQSAVRFEMDHFFDSFHGVFVRCRDAGVTLHPCFLPLGLCLAGLYETLEALGAPLDVRRAFGEARGVGRGETP